MTNCEEASEYYNDLAKAKELSLTQNVNLVWHKFSAEKPKKCGDYLCKVRKISYCIDYYQYEVLCWSSYWIMLEQGWIVVAWAEIPECKFKLEKQE